MKYYNTDKFLFFIIVAVFLETPDAFLRSSKGSTDSGDLCGSAGRRCHVCVSETVSEGYGGLM